MHLKQSPGDKGKVLTGGTLGPSLRGVGWQEQAQRATYGTDRENDENQGWNNGSSCAKEGTKYRSTAVYCEVKLAEMLHKGRRRIHQGKAEESGPDSYRTSVCCQLLSEMCEMSMPFARVLSTIRNELALSIYSNYYVSPDGTLSFDQVPYFTVVERLEKEKAELEAEQERWRIALMERQGDVGRIETQMHALEAQVSVTEVTNAELKSQLSACQAAYEVARAEVRVTKEELRRLKKELIRAKGEVQRALQVEQECLLEREEHERLKAVQSQTMHELHRLRAIVEVERSDAADSIPPKEMEAAQMTILDLQAKLSAVTAVRRGSVTPRPDWEKLRERTKGGFADVALTTAEQAAEVCAANEKLVRDLEAQRDECASSRVRLAEAAEHLREAEALIPPDPDVIPASVRNSLGLNGDGSERRGSSIATLGMGAELPRFLRTSAASVRYIGLQGQNLLELVSEMWVAKVEHCLHEAADIPMPDFVYRHVLKKVGSHAECCELMYNVLQEIRRAKQPIPADIQLFQSVLYGEMSEEVYWDRLRMLDGLKKLFETASRHTKAGGGQLGLKDAVECIESFFAAKNPDLLQALTEALAAKASDEVVPYDTMFDDAERLLPDSFLTLVTQQHFQEIKEYCTGLNWNLCKLRDGPEARSGKLSVSRLWSALSSYDATKPNGEVDALVAFAARLGPLSSLHGSLKTKKDVEVEIGPFLARLMSKCLVKRSNNYDLTAISKWSTPTSGVRSDGDLPLPA